MMCIKARLLIECFRVEFFNTLSKGVYSSRNKGSSEFE